MSVIPDGSFEDPDGGGLGAGGGSDDGGGVVAAALTVIDALPLLPSAEAVMTAAPVLTVLTRPFASTAAFAVLELDHVTARPVITLSAESSSVTEACVVCPRVIEVAGRLTLTAAT
jgi:hypothetical protein